jgi:hypothetical protein
MLLEHQRIRQYNDREVYPAAAMAESSRRNVGM